MAGEWKLAVIRIRRPGRPRSLRRRYAELRYACGGGLREHGVLKLDEVGVAVPLRQLDTARVLGTDTTTVATV